MEHNLTSIPDVLDDFKQGKMIILVDDEARENEGDLVIPASCITPDHINFMAMYGRGLICLAMSAQNIDRLSLPLMTDQNDCKLGTAFTVSIDAKENVSTGISAHDRAHTVRLATETTSSREDFSVPGHIFPLRARTGGVLERAGHTEAATDLAVLSGYNSAAVICEIMKDDGTMARMDDLKEFSKQHNIAIASIHDLIQYKQEQKDAA